jgi:hypothetical protein
MDVCEKLANSVQLVPLLVVRYTLNREVAVRTRQ